MNKGKWNEICFLLSESIKQDISKNDFEQNVIKALEALNWKEYLGDIQIRPDHKFGSAGSLRPDFVICSSEKEKNLFIIEIEQPSLPLNTDFQQQLFSYMRQLKLEYGLLIGQAIQLFYDGDLSDHNEPVLLETIEFEKDNSKGEKFVELFSKDNFSFDSLKQFTHNSLKRINRKAEQRKLHKKILSIDYQSQVVELIKQDLLSQYDGELIDNVLKDISISITSKKKIELDTPTYQPKATQRAESTTTREYDYTKYLFNGSTLGKGRFALEVVTEYTKRNPITFEKLKQVSPDQMQGSTGVINTLEFIEEKYEGRTKKRHFVKDDEILISADNIEFAVSTEWGVGNINRVLEFAKKEGFQVEEVK